MIRDRLILGRKTRSFTLQWHLTNTCPFSCRHCYDRSERTELSLADAREVLRGFRDFCRRRRVEPRLSLSGGDPLACSHFWELYQDIAETGIPTSILGNPLPERVLDRLTGILFPTYYQVSLEGLPEANDAIRGPGHFDRTMAFLRAARSRGVETHVMLTLTRDNQDQVIPLGSMLRGWTARLTFNRLAQVGGGTGLELPSRQAFARFLIEYLEARPKNPVLGVKENLLSILRHFARLPLFHGCTGCGCGAAFNFVALLPDGEVHACRKFPSCLGNIRQMPLDEIFDLPSARRYRQGALACRGCRLRPVCGGCMAVVYGRGLDPLVDRDPFCFFEDFDLCGPARDGHPR